MDCVNSVMNSRPYDPIWKTAAVVGTLAAVVSIVALICILGHHLDKSLLDNATTFKPHVIAALWQTAKWSGIGAVGLLGGAFIMAAVKLKLTN